MKSQLLTGLAMAGVTYAAGLQTIDKKTLNAAGAQRVIAAATGLARKLGTTGVIAVVDDGGNLLALERMDGAFPAGANISIGKARTAALFKKPTRVFEEIVGKGRTAMVALNDFTPLVGGVPVLLDGDIVGAVGVSGAASAQQDEELALAGAAALHGADSPAAVTYFERAKVDEAFAQGAVLFDAGERYMIHASRRESAGMAEVHMLDTDIVHVLDGTATLVTGGQAVDLKPVAGAGEYRGTSIAGGDERRLSRGDVVVIPAGVPHWFREVPAPLLYYVVKVR